MSWKGLIALLVLAAAAAWGVYEYRLKPQQAATDSGGGSAAPADAQKPLAELGEAINEVNGLRVTGGDGEFSVELRRGEQGDWTVASKNDFPADRESVTDLLLALADAEVIELKTKKAELYPRLDLADPGSDDGAGTRVELLGVEPALDVIVGQSSPGGGTYLRRADDAQTYLVSGTIIPSVDLQQWMAQPIVALPAGRWQRVVIKQPDGELLTVAKQGRNDTTFKPFNLLQDRALKSDTEANPIGNVLSELRLEDAIPFEQAKPDEQQTVTAEFYGFDGLRVTAQLFQQDERNLVHLRASYDEAQAEQFALPAQTPADGGSAADDSSASTAEGQQDGQQDKADSGDDAGADATAEGDDVSDAGADVRAQAEAIDQRTADWTFQISQFKYDSMTKRLDDLLQPAESEAAAASDADSAPPEPQLPAGALPVMPQPQQQ